MPTSVNAAEDDQVSFGYQYYQESERARVIPSDQPDPTSPHTNLKPITVDSISGKARISLTDRVKFAFNYVQDTWGGATPISTAPIVSLGVDSIAVASPQTPRTFFIDNKGNFVGGRFEPGIIDNRIAHAFASASPETRRQGDFKLDYEWDDMALGVGGGVSEEPDYHSAFFNTNARWDFNRKLTSLSLGLSYTTSEIGKSGSDFGPVIEQTPRSHASGIGDTFKADRQDWTFSLGLSHILAKNTVLHGGMSFTQNNGFLSNPYKIVNLYSVSDPIPGDPLKTAAQLDAYEKRPGNRSQFNWNIGLVQYIESLDAAVRLDYSFFHDNWGINAHTFASAWNQPVGWGWTLSPNIRYYSQTAASFYSPFFLLGPDAFVFDTTKPLGSQLDFSKLPIKNFSSDQRLSGYGTLSGGMTISKQFAKGLNLAISGEYYKHAGSLQLDGKLEGSYADFDYFTVNATLNVDLAALTPFKGGSSAPWPGSHPGHHQHSSHAPAAVMFAHALDKAGDAMVGYRYQYGADRGGILHGTQAASDQSIIDNGCPDTDACRFAPSEMTMNMHMLELMYAPTDWLTLMLMPQFMDMDMTLRPLDDAPPVTGVDSGAHNHTGVNGGGHTTSGIGDTGMFALINLFNNPVHHLHLSLGANAPTGTVAIKHPGANSSSQPNFLHYGMQIGSGTWDFKPSLTYLGQIDRWSWGGQLSGAKRLEDRNESGYALGDLFQATAWGGYNVFDWLSASVRGVYTVQGAIKHQFNTHKATKNFQVFSHVGYDVNGNGNCSDRSIGCNGVYDPGDVEQNGVDRVVSVPNAISGPMDEPGSYGGQYADIGFGLSATIPDGTLAGHRFSFEWLQPVYTDVNGYQLDRTGALSATWSYGF